MIIFILQYHVFPVELCKGLNLKVKYDVIIALPDFLVTHTLCTYIVTCIVGRALCMGFCYQHNNRHCSLTFNCIIRAGRLTFWGRI